MAKIYLSAILIFLLGLFSNASAVTFTYVAVDDSMPSNLGVASGTFSYEANAVDLINSPAASEYFPAIIQGSISGGFQSGRLFSISDASLRIVAGSYSYSLRQRLSGAVTELRLDRDPLPDLSDRPPASLSLVDFNSAILSIANADVGIEGGGVRLYTIESISRVSEVPLPPSIVFLFASMLPVIGITVRRISLRKVSS